MINRTKMPRQLRNKGGITNVIPRKKYGIGSDLKDFARKIIPNEIADVAVKVAPFVAPFNPGVAGLMRGIGRFDQRGSISDALKQGIATTAFGAGSRFLGGAENIMGGGLRGGFTSPLNVDRTKAVKSLFKGKEFDDADKLKRAKSIENTPEFMKTATEATIGKVPLLDQLPPMVQQKLLVGGVTAGASALYSYFTGEFEPQEPGETMGEYMARRNKRVKEQMRGYMDSYYTPLRNPQYAAMSDEEKNNFIDNIVGQTSLEGTTDYQGMATGGRVGYQTGGITMGNTLAENIRRNRANQAAFQQSIAPAQQRARSKIQEYAMSDDSILGPLSKKAASTIMAGQDKSQAALDVLNKTMAPTSAGEAGGIITDGDQVIRIGSGVPEEYDSLNKAFTAVQAPTIADSASSNLLPGFSRFMANDALQPPGSYNYIDNRGDIYTEKEYANLQDINQTGMPRTITQDDIDTFNFNMSDPMITGFDYSGQQAFSWSPGQPAPEGYRVVNMMGDEFLERKFPSKEEVARLPVPLAGPMGLMRPEDFDNYANRNEDPDAGLSGQEIAEKYGIPYAKGGRVKFSEGSNLKIKLKQIGYEDTLLDTMSLKELRELLDSEKGTFTSRGTYREPANMGGAMPTGIMRSNKAGVMERDYRDKGGFVPVGIKEKADDVPAMLSKNEFVFTADAVRGAGNGSIEKGAQKMYDTMKNLERRVV